MATQCHSRLVAMAIDTADFIYDLLIPYRGVEILVDGAHALGALPISMRYEITCLSHDHHVTPLPVI